MGVLFAGELETQLWSPGSAHTPSVQLTRVKQFNCSPKPGWVPRTSTVWRGESLRYHSSTLPVCVCVCEEVHGHASECMTYVFARVCMRCSGSMLDVGTRQSWLVPGVMATYRGRPSVWYSAALWGLIAVTSLGTPCTLLIQGLHQVAPQLCESNDETIE